MPLLEWDLPYDIESLIFDAIDVAETHIRESYYDNQHPHVLSRAPDVTTALLACSCVCKVWRKYALERLFKVVKVRMLHYTAPAVSQLKQRWHVNVKIQTLDFDWYVHWTRENFEEISPELEGLQSLIAGNCIQLAMLDGSVPNLRFLDLKFIRPLPRKELCHMLIGVPRLKVLHLQSSDGGFISMGEEHRPQLPSLSMKLEEFRVFQDIYQQDLDCWLWLLESSQESLHTATVHCDLRNAKPFIAAFKCVGKSIRKLNLTYGPNTHQPLGIRLLFGQALLPLCPNLTHATFHLEWFLDGYAIAGSVVPPTLTSIRLCEKLHEGRNYETLADVVLKAVAVGHLAKLQELILDVQPSGHRHKSLYFIIDWQKRVNERLSVVGIECRLVVYKGKPRFSLD